MKRLFVFLAVLMCVGPAWSKPQMSAPNSSSSMKNTYSILFPISDTADSDAIGVSGFCTVRYEQASGDDVSLYAVTTADTAASSGTLLKAFSTSTSPSNPAYTFTASTQWVKAKATDASAGGSRLIIDCSPTFGSAGGGGAAFDSCRDGSVQGGGYDSVTGRWDWTCGNFNWHAWKDSTQTDASFDVNCTGDGAGNFVDGTDAGAHAYSCIRSGEVRHVGYGLHRIALAAQYTKDGGQVYLPEGIYTDNGAGKMADGTTNSSFPEPYDPSWETRSDFTQLGYPTQLRVIQIARGVRLIGENSPDALSYDPNDSTVTDNLPKLIGTWIQDDRGTAYGADGTSTYSGVGATYGGVNGTTKPPGFYRIQVGGNPYFSFCKSTSNTDPTCLKTDTTDTYEDSTDSPNLANLWGTSFSTTINFDPSSLLLCVPDSRNVQSGATSADGLGTGEANAIGTCSGNRMIRCWDDSDSSELRATGGCDFGAGGDYGACQSPYEALKADYETAGGDLQLAMDMTECTDNASSSSDCAAPLGHELYITDMRVKPGATLTGGDCGTNGTATAGQYVYVGNAKQTSGNDFSNVFPFRYFYVGGTGAYNKIFPIRRGSMDGKGAGFEHIGRMPANWLTRNSTTNGADCLSGSTTSVTDDESACDTDTLSGFAMSYNNLIGPDNLFYKASQADSTKSAVVETVPSGGPNHFVGNRIRTSYRHLMSDWGEGTFAYNHISDLGAFSGVASIYGVFACYGGQCVFENNTVENSSVSYVYLGQTAAQSLVSRNNTFQNNQYGQPPILIRGVKNFLSDGDQFYGSYSAPIMQLIPGYDNNQKPSVTIRNMFVNSEVTPLASSTTADTGWPGAIFVVKGDGAANSRADDYKSLLIDNVNVRSYVSDLCLVWFDDDFYASGAAGGAADTASLNREAAVRTIVQNSNLTSPTTTGGAKIACTGKARFVASALDADDSDSWATEAYAPALLNNKINNAPVYDMLPTISETLVPVANTIPDGTVVRIYDGTAACAHSSGNLTAGAVTETCISDQSANTWAVWP